MNKIILIGNLTRDPETSTTASGITMCKFSVAVNRRYGNKDGNDAVDYFNIVAWRGVAESCGKILTKGRKVAVTGSVQIRNYEAQDGTRRQAIDVVADEVEFLPSGDRNAAGESGSHEVPARKEAPRPVQDLTPVDDDDLPF